MGSGFEWSRSDLCPLWSQLDSSIVSAMKCRKNQEVFTLKRKGLIYLQFNTTKVNNNQIICRQLQAIGECKQCIHLLGCYILKHSDTSTNTGGARIIYAYYGTLRKHGILQSTWMSYDGSIIRSGVRCCWQQKKVKQAWLSPYLNPTKNVQSTPLYWPFLSLFSSE